MPEDNYIELDALSTATTSGIYVIKATPDLTSGGITGESSRSVGTVVILPAQTVATQQDTPVSTPALVVVVSCSTGSFTYSLKLVKLTDTTTDGTSHTYTYEEYAASGLSSLGSEVGVTTESDTAIALAGDTYKVQNATVAFTAAGAFNCHCSCYGRRQC